MPPCTPSLRPHGLKPQPDAAAPPSPVAPTRDEVRATNDRKTVPARPVRRWRLPRVLASAPFRLRLLPGMIG